MLGAHSNDHICSQLLRISVHHMIKGTRKERTRSAFVTISPAVLHGGVTTFLSLVFLASSESYCFITFFKIMSAIVILGLFHGLLFLPSMLSFSCGGNVHRTTDLEKELSNNGKDNSDFKTHK